MTVNGGGKGETSLESLFVRDDDIFQTSVSSDDYLESLAPIVKDALKANGLASLITNLNDIVKAKDEELTELSLASTKDIDTCVESIDKIHADSSDLNKSLQQVSSFLNKSVFELVSRKKNLLRTKERNQKINETTVVLSLCIQVLELTNKIHELIKQNRYFNALKLLDELTSIHLPKVDNFSFAVKIYDSAPLLTKTIKEESFDNMCKWLSINVERKLFSIGEALFENLYRLQHNWAQVQKDNGKTFLSHRINSPVEVSMRDPSLNYSIFSDESLKINLATVFDAILAYQTLNESDLLAKLYHKEWMKKYNRVIYPITSSVARTSTLQPKSEAVAEFQDLASLEEYLKKISAFFVMDKQINLATKFDVRSNTSSDDLWDSYVTKLKTVVLYFLESHNLNVDELNDFKDLIGTFMQVMENNEFRISEIYDVLLVVLREYLAVDLIQQFRFDFLESIQSDHYMSLVVQNKNDYDNVMKICWYKDDASFAPANVRAMPISFPFSEDYVHFCLGIRSLMEDLVSFTNQYYGYELNEVNAIIVNTFEDVLGDRKNVGIAHDLKDFITKNINNKEVISQSYANLEYYLYSIYEIGNMINRRLKMYNGIGTNNIDTNGTLTLRAIKLFTDLRKYAEDSIFNMVDLKVKELLDMVEYDDWFPTVANREANYSVKDFALFLDNLFSSIFSTLPSSFRTLGLFRSYDFVAQHFLNLLKNADRFNRIAIDNFDLDVKYLEESMNQLSKNSEAETDGGSVSLQSTFTELRQCLDLLKLDDYDDFKKNPQLRMRRFDRVKFEDGVRLIAKMQADYEDDEAQDDSFDQQSMLSTSTAAKFAKFSNKFRTNM